MTQDEIIDMARQVGIEAESDTLCRFGGWVEPFVAFANLVAAKAEAKEREACAKVCEEEGLLWGRRYATAIRARGQA